MTMNDIFLGAIRMHTQKGIPRISSLPCFLEPACCMAGPSETEEGKGAISLPSDFGGRGRQIPIAFLPPPPLDFQTFLWSCKACLLSVMRPEFSHHFAF